MIVMPGPKQVDDANSEATSLLKKLLILQLFGLGVPQGDISKKLRMSINTVNEFLRGINKKIG